jgi:hypothetical protein
VTGILRKSTQVVAEKILPLDQRGVFKQLCDQLSALLKDNGLRNASAKIVLSDALARMWVVDPPLNTSSLSDLQAAAAARFQVLYGETPAQWVIQADYQADRTFLAAAMPSAWLEAIEVVRRDFQLKINEIAPLSPWLPTTVGIIYYRQGLGWSITKREKLLLRLRVLKNTSLLIGTSGVDHKTLRTKAASHNFYVNKPCS